MKSIKNILQAVEQAPDTSPEGLTPFAYPSQPCAGSCAITTVASTLTPDGMSVCLHAL